MPLGADSLHMKLLFFKLHSTSSKGACSLCFIKICLVKYGPHCKTGMTAGARKEATFHASKLAPFAILTLSLPSGSLGTQMFYKCIVSPV